jgi:hypothetical protein
MLEKEGAIFFWLMFYFVCKEREYLSIFLPFVFPFPFPFFLYGCLMGARSPILQSESPCTRSPALTKERGCAVNREQRG